MSAARKLAAASAGMLCWLVMTGCSSGPGRSGIDPLVRAQLRHDLALLSQAAAAHNVAAARAALATLTADAAAAHTAGTLTDSRFQKLQAAARAVGLDLTPAPPRPAPPTSEPTSPANDHGNGHGHDHGGGNNDGNNGENNGGNNGD